MKTNTIKKITIAFILILVIFVLTSFGMETIKATTLNALAKTLVQTSLIAFYSTLIFFVLTFKWFKTNYLLWLILLINLPVAAIYSPTVFQNIRFSIIDTTTPPEFRYSNTVEKLKYKRDVVMIEGKIDSLIRLGVVTRPTDYGERSLEGNTYRDSLDRRRGFPAKPFNVPLELKVDTLFYSPGNKNLIAGTLIRKYNHIPLFYSGDSVAEYRGNAFIYNPNDYEFQFITLRASFFGCSSEQECSNALLDEFLKKRGLSDIYYNMNDSRFWSNTDWEIKFKPGSSDKSINMNYNNKVTLTD